MRTPTPRAMRRELNETVGDLVAGEVMRISACLDVDGDGRHAVGPQVRREIARARFAAAEVDYVTPCRSLRDVGQGGVR